MCNVTFKHTPVKKQAPLTTQSNSLRCVLAAEHHTAESTQKLVRQNPKSISQGSIYHGMLTKASSGYQVFEKLLWKLSKDASQKLSKNQMSLPIYQGHQTHSSENSFFGDWGCIIHDLETIIILVLLTIYFIPKGHTNDAKKKQFFFAPCFFC